LDRKIALVKAEVERLAAAKAKRDAGNHDNDIDNYNVLLILE
jgi:uncharacterized small protein (DUF1192 family)